jgi:hypothetical protein
MTLNEYNYLYGIKQIITGGNVSSAADGGFLEDQDISFELRGFSTGATSTVVMYNTVIPSTGTIVYGPFHIPRSYDQTSDTLQFRFLGTVGANITEPVAAWLNIYAPGVSTSPANTTVAQNATVTLSTGYYNVFAVSVSGNGLAQDDVIYLNLSTSTVPITVIGGAMVFDSCQVAWDMYGNEFVGTSTQEIRG